MAPAPSKAAVESEGLPVKAGAEEVPKQNSEEKEKDDPFAQDVDVIGFGDGVADVADGGSQDPNATDQSSSFGNTFSGSEDEARLSSSDMEVDSQFSAENVRLPVASKCGRIFRKKKVTASWRRFISPLTWRCQWLELRMNELQSQISVYDKELAGYKREKQLQAKMIELDDSVSRSVPLICHTHKTRAMRRNRRKRIEDTTDTSSYMSNHNIYSYYENKKCETDGHSIDDGCASQVHENTKGVEDHEWLFRNGVDNSLEKIFFDIEALQSRVLKMKNQLSKITVITSKERPSAAGNTRDQQTGFGQSNSCSPGTFGDRPRHPSEYEFEEFVKAGSGVSSHGEVPDLDTKSTVDILAAHKTPVDQNQTRPSCVNDFGGNLINNQPADSNVEEKPKQLVKEEAHSSDDESTAPGVSAQQPVPGNNNLTMQLQQPAIRPCYTGKKRGRKPKKKRRGGSASGYKSERLQKRRIS